MSITNGIIAQSHTNYAVINANAGCILRGQKYEHTTQTRRINRQDVGVNTIEKIVAIENATFVSQHNIDNVIEKCYNWIVRTNSTNLRIVEGKHIKYGGKIKYGQSRYGSFKYGEHLPSTITYDQRVSVGDTIQAETEYLGIIKGMAIKQTFNLNGNTIVKDTVMR